MHIAGTGKIIVDMYFRGYKKCKVCGYGLITEREIDTYSYINFSTSVNGTFYGKIVLIFYFASLETITKFYNAK
jgi:hypothetical protein